MPHRNSTFLHSRVCKADCQLCVVSAITLPLHLLLFTGVCTVIVVILRLQNLLWICTDQAYMTRALHSSVRN